MDKAMEILTKQALRGRILNLCKVSQPLGAAMEVLTAMLRKEGFKVSKEEVFEECSYLEGKGLIEIVFIENAVLGISREIAHIKPAGIDLLEGTTEAGGIDLEG